jgi:hypothetical protein
MKHVFFRLVFRSDFASKFGMPACSRPNRGVSGQYYPTVPSLNFTRVIDYVLELFTSV